MMMLIGIKYVALPDISILKLFAIGHDLVSSKCSVYSRYDVKLILKSISAATW